MSVLIREIYPIGKGGFARETIDGFTIVYDCGSTSPARITQYIDCLKTEVSKIDILFISHFDKDHVDGIDELIRAIGVKKAVIPAIPEKYKVAYNVFTNNAYDYLRDILDREERKFEELSEVKEYGSDTNIWKWEAYPMLMHNDWSILVSKFRKARIQTDNLENVSYVNSKKNEINSCFKKCFGVLGPNSKGLLLLSLNNSDFVVINKLLQPTCYAKDLSPTATAALYTGDANLRNRDNINYLRGRLDNSSSFSIIQIPHHGSSRNAGNKFDEEFSSEFYFFHDKSSKRLQKNGSLYKSLKQNKKLLEVRDVDSDKIRQEIEIKV